MAAEKREEGRGEFKAPVRYVKVPEDMPAWFESKAYNEFMNFILILNDSVKGRSNKDVMATLPPSPIIMKLEEMLDMFLKWVDELPPIDQPQRFGNKAFKSWKERLNSNAKAIIKNLLPDEERFAGAEVELEPYLREGFGNATRIDYGTGHEFKFVAFLFCLVKLDVVPRDDAPSLVVRVVKKYLDLVRKLQTEYRMEPAGSHGVWGLDDFQFVPFIWGSSQLIGHLKLEPKSFVEEKIAELNSSDYLFMDCIKFIQSVKTGPFSEHSNVLWGISAVPEWRKVNSGLIKMFKDEVLGKFPVIQHFPFGSLLSFEKNS